MSDEVKQAAERLQDFHSNGRGYDDDMAELVETTRHHLDDLESVAMAYLSEHANDDENATPLTAEILQASGWVPSVAGTIWDHQMTRMQLRVDVNNWHVSACGVRIGTVETVCDLRRLLETLHIDAVVVVPKGGE